MVWSLPLTPGQSYVSWVLSPGLPDADETQMEQPGTGSEQRKATLIIENQV